MLLFWKRCKKEKMNMKKIVLAVVTTVLFCMTGCQTDVEKEIDERISMKEMFVLKLEKGFVDKKIPVKKEESCREFYIFSW